MKGNGHEAYHWKFCDKEWSVYETQVEIKYKLPSYMRDKLEDNQEDNIYLIHEYWCDLLSTIEVKYNSKRAATQIKNIASTRSSSHSDSDESVRIPRNKKARNGVLRNNKGTDKKAHKHHGNQRHCMICKKAVMPGRKYMYHSAEDCFGKRTDQKSIRGGLVWLIGSRDEDVEQYKRPKSKW